MFGIFLCFHRQEILNPKWDKYVAFRQRIDHERFGLDWSVGQDFLITCWNNRQWLIENFHINLVDATNKYNFCPAADLVGIEEAQIQIIDAYRRRSVAILHLKSQLKALIYGNVFDDIVLRYPRSTEYKWKDVKGK